MTEFLTTVEIYCYDEPKITQTLRAETLDELYELISELYIDFDLYELEPNDYRFIVSPIETIHVYNSFEFDYNIITKTKSYIQFLEEERKFKEEQQELYLENDTKNQYKLYLELKEKFEPIDLYK